MKRNLPILLFLLVLIGLPPIGAGQFWRQRADRLRNDFPAQAMLDYERAARLLFWEPGLLEQAGLAAYQAGEAERAQALLLKAREKEPLSTQGLFTLGETYYLSDDIETAYTEAWYPLYQKSSVTTEPATPALLWRLAKYREHLLDFPGSVFYLRLVVTADPQDATAYHRLALIQATDNPAQALEYLELAERLQPAGNNQLLREALQHALQNPTSPSRYIVIGRVHLQLGERALALKTFEEALVFYPDYAEAWAWLAEVLYQIGEDNRLVESYYEKALTLNPAAAGIHTMAGLYWERQGHYRQAEALYQRATELEPQEPVWLLALARVTAQRDLPLALEHYLKATEMDPYHFSTWYALAAFCVENEAFLNDYGLEAALRAYALEPEDPQVMDLLGRALAATGETESAKVIYAKAIAAAPEAAAPHFHLALLYLQINLRAEAKAMFQETQHLDPDGPYGTQAKNILDRYFP